MTIEYHNEPLEQIGRRLTGSVYIGVAGSEIELGAAYRSVNAIIRRTSDSQIYFGEGTKGVEVRQEHVDAFLRSEHNFILFLDGDMDYPPETLEVLRSHGLPCVSALAFRRTYKPTTIPAWYEDDPGFNWPMMPFRETPEVGRLYRLGATGFFCWLIHRSVFEAVTPVLKGELPILEDDMDVWPYSLPEVIAGREKLRLLRGIKRTVGADVRLSFFIRQAGFTIWGDPGVTCGHYINYPLGLAEWASYGREFRRQFGQMTDENLTHLRAEHRQVMDAIQEASQ